MAIFFAYGGLRTFTSIAGVIIGIGAVVGLIGANLLLIQILLAARIPIIDRTFGHDKALLIHHRLGTIIIWFLLAHMTLITTGYAVRDGINPMTEFGVIIGNLDGVVLAFAAIIIFTAIVLMSLVSIRRRLPYELWHFMHLLVYVATVLAIPHQFLVTSYFAEGQVARYYWIALYLGTAVTLLVSRVIVPIVRTLRLDLRVASATEVAPGVTTIELAGLGLERLKVHGGQFMLWRFLAPGLWWQAHPYSLSDVPRDGRLRITVRTLGDGSARVARVPLGTRVAVEGPFGIFTEHARVTDGIVLIAAGIGVTPIRSMLEHVDFAPGRGTVILRSPSADAVYLGEEVAKLAARKKATLHTLVGSRERGGEGWLPATSVASGQTLATLAPHIQDSDVYICGPGPWTQLVIADARAAGVPRANIHYERFGW